MVSSKNVKQEIATVPICVSLAIIFATSTNCFGKSINFVTFSIAFNSVASLLFSPSFVSPNQKGTRGEEVQFSNTKSVGNTSIKPNGWFWEHPKSVILFKHPFQ